MLFAVAYQTLGSSADAEDLLQEALIRWQQTEIEIESARALSRGCLFISDMKSGSVLGVFAHYRLIQLRATKSATRAGMTTV